MNVSTVTGYIAKGVGIAGAGLALYDSHILGKIQAASSQKTIKADSLEKSYENTMSLDKPSIVESNIKKSVFNLNAEETMSDFFTGIGGYIKGFVTMAVSNVIPIALSVGTLATKGTVSKCFGGGLLAYGAVTLLHEGFGIGKHEKIGNTF